MKVVKSVQSSYCLENSLILKLNKAFIMPMNINNVVLQMGTIYLTGSTMVTVDGAWELEAVYANSMRTTHTL